MKFYISQIDLLVHKVGNGKIKALLLYGPDKGYIREICEVIARKFESITTSVEYQKVTATNLEMQLNTKNFFNKKELVKITSVTSTISPELKTILGNNFFHFPVFIADELPLNSTIRKFFETETYLASLACYHDDEQNIIKLILKKCSEAKKSIDNEALYYLKSHLKGDHQGILNEINKLLLFINKKGQITLADVENSISPNLIASGDDLCIYFAKKTLDKFLEELNKLLANNINEVLIIRTLIRYYINLYIVRTKIDNGDNVDNAIKFLSPPIFFKYIDDFKKAANNLTSQDILKTLSILQQAELDFKLKPLGFDLYQQLWVANYEDIF